MLNPKYLSQVLEGIAFTPVIHLFASRINKQFDQYVIQTRSIGQLHRCICYILGRNKILLLSSIQLYTHTHSGKKDRTQQSQGSSGSTAMANKVMVSHSFSNIGTTTSCPSTSAESVTNAIQTRAEAPATQEAKNSYLSCIRGKLQVRGFSADTIYIILSLRGYPNSVQISCQEML